MTLPKEDRSYETRSSMKNAIVHLLGGRVAEALTLDDISTGASNDIMRATEVARDMVTKYGFSERLGTVNYSSSEEVFLGNDFTTHKNYSDEVAREIDEEIKDIIAEAYAQAEKLLTENMDVLKRVAEALLLVETIDGQQFEDLFTGKYSAQQLAENVKVSEEAKKVRDKEEAEENERLRREEEERLKAELENTIRIIWIAMMIPILRLTKRMTQKAAAPAQKMKPENPMKQQMRLRREHQLTRK